MAIVALGALSVLHRAWDQRHDGERDFWDFYSWDGQLHTSLYDKRGDFNFHITNIPCLSSNIPSSPAYGVFISQLIRYARAYSSCECSILRAVRLSNKLLGQGYVKEYKKRLLQRCIHHFLSDIINNVDHMRISGTEPSSVILSQTK